MCNQRFNKISLNPISFLITPIKTNAPFRCFRSPHSLEIPVCVHTNPVPWDRAQLWAPACVLTYAACVALPAALSTAQHAGMRERQGMLWSCSVSAWDWRIIQLFSIVLPAAMYSHLDVLESKVVWSSGKVKYPIILLAHWGDGETVIEMKTLPKETSQIIFVAHFWECFCFFPQLYWRMNVNVL